MRVSVRAALMALVLGGIGLSSIAVHGLWWRTADNASRALVTTLNAQVADAVKKELALTIAAAQGAWGAVRTIFLQNVIETREADKREFVFLSQLQAQPAISWIAFGWPDGHFFAARKLGDQTLEMTEIGEENGERKRRADQYQVYPGDIEFRRRFFEPSSFKATDEPWYAAGDVAEQPVWLELGTPLDKTRPAIAYAGPIEVYQKREGILAVLIELSRLSRFLSTLDIGAGRGAVFILGPDGAAIAAPDPQADETQPIRMTEHPLFPLAQRTQLADRRASSGPRQTASRRVEEAGAHYSVATTPLRFLGWEVVTVIPEAVYLAEIEATTQRLAFAIGGLVLLAGIGSALISQRLLARPIRAVAGDLAKVESFDVERIEPRPSRLTELDRLSAATARMAAGLAAFRKYLPADLVRTLVAEGIEARPGGTMRPLTILFADLAGFTGLSERLGAGIVPLVSAYLDAATGAIGREGGTVDKFIGDAVMAFWNAPREHPEPALAACRAALGLIAAVRERGIVDDEGRPLGLRIGINSGEVLVGNIGSAERLNYTVIGDAVNIASRLEALNKRYGTAILIGEETHRQAGAAILAREIDSIALYGRDAGIAVYELLGLAGEAPPGWVGRYAEGLAAYRARRFAEALAASRAVIAARGGDGPAARLAAACEALIAAPPAADWRAVTVMDEK